MLMTVEKVLHLKAVPLFASLPSEELAGLAEIAEEQSFPAEAVIFKENDRGDELYVLVSGRVRVYRTMDSTEQTIAILGPRECFGEMAVLDDEPRSASIATLEDSVTLKIRREDFLELVIDRPQFAFEIFKVLTRRLRMKSIEAENIPVFETAQHYI